MSGGDKECTKDDPMGATVIRRSEGPEALLTSGVLQKRVRVRCSEVAMKKTSHDVEGPLPR